MCLKPHLCYSMVLVVVVNFFPFHSPILFLWGFEVVLELTYNTNNKTGIKK